MTPREHAVAILSAERAPHSTEPVQDLLDRSRAAHLRYRQLSTRYNPATQQMELGDPLAARQALIDASILRAQAELADPDHQQVGWLAEVGTSYEHEPLIEFYHSQLVRA